MAAVNAALEALCSVVVGMMLLSCLLERKVNRESRYLIGLLAALLVMLLSDCISWIIPDASSIKAAAYTVISITYISGYVWIGCFLRYLNEFVTERKRLMRAVLRCADVLCVLSVLLILVNPFVDGLIFSFSADGQYVQDALYWLSNAYPVASLTAAAVLTLTAPGLGRGERVVFLTYPVFVLIGMGMDYFFDNAIFVSLGTFLSALTIYIQLYAQRGRRIAEQEKELMQDRISITLSQIQPHFLYNSLNAIYYLCETDPSAAQETIERFSNYLRGNLDSLKRKTPVPFDKELEHIRIYLSLEKMRFDNELNVEYDIGTTAFMLPALTVQPLVENAVKYGVGKKPGGGTVCIKTREYADHIEVTVSDDGVGYDPNATQDDGRTHIGIDNVRSRLGVMCAGTLDIESRPGSGTVATIRLPKSHAGK